MSDFNKLEFEDNDIQVRLAYRPHEEDSDKLIEYLAGLMLELKKVKWCELVIDVDRTEEIDDEN